MADISVSFAKDPFILGKKDYVKFTAKKGRFGDLHKHITSNVWSPVVWTGGYRAKVNFLQANLVALDFDEGYSLEEATTWVKEMGVQVIIGTTQSHQREKTKDSGTVAPPCDRFRVIFLAEICMSLADYEYTNEAFMHCKPCDKACKDGAHYFKPCREIVYENYDGPVIGWAKAPPKKPFVRKNYSKGQMPLWVSGLINNGVRPGGRNVACFKVGAELTRCNYSETEIVTMVMRGPLRDIGRTEVESSVRNGIRAEEGARK